MVGSSSRATRYAATTETKRQQRKKLATDAGKGTNISPKADGRAGTQRRVSRFRRARRWLDRRHGTSSSLSRLLGDQRRLCGRARPPLRARANRYALGSALDLLVGSDYS